MQNKKLLYMAGALLALVVVGGSVFFGNAGSQKGALIRFTPRGLQNVTRPAVVPKVVQMPTPAQAKLGCTMTASASEIAEGDSVVVTMTTTGNPVTVKLHGIDVGVSGGTASFSPTITTTYQGGVIDAGGQMAECGFIVKVRPLGCTIIAPDIAEKGKPITLTVQGEKIVSTVLKRDGSYVAADPHGATTTFYAPNLTMTDTPDKTGMVTYVAYPYFGTSSKYPTCEKRVEVK